MTEENAYAKIAAARIMRAELKKIADDKSHPKIARAWAACLVEICTDVLPLYESEGTRQTLEIARDYIKAFKEHEKECENRRKAA